MTPSEIHEVRAQAVSLTEDALNVDLADGRTILVPLVWFPRLWHGTRKERKSLEIAGDGAYIHWPELDEDLTVAGLLAGQHSSESPKSCRNGWIPGRLRGAGREPEVSIAN